METDDCWEWNKNVSKRGDGLTGYGYVYIPKSDSSPNRGKRVRASRFFYGLIGTIPEGMQVLHRCDNKLCVNPAHLFLGTQKDNMDDCAAKGRTYRGGAHNPQAGEEHVHHKLTQAQVDELRLRKARDRTPNRTLAEDYGISSCAVSRIINGLKWKKSYRGKGVTLL